MGSPYPPAPPAIVLGPQDPRRQWVEEQYARLERAAARAQMDRMLPVPVRERESRIPKVEKP